MERLRAGQSPFSGFTGPERAGDEPDDTGETADTGDTGGTGDTGDTGDWGRSGWTHDEMRGAADELVATEGWDQESRDALHGLYDIASDVYGQQPLDIVDFSEEMATADGKTLPTEIVFSDENGNRVAVEWPSSKATLLNGDAGDMN